MDDKTSSSSNALMDINPDARGNNDLVQYVSIYDKIKVTTEGVQKLLQETKLIVNKDIRTLEDLRKNFNPVQSSVLSQVRDFLPKLATANEDLKRRLEDDPDYSADIEHLDDAEATHIEMSLALVETNESSEDESLDSDTSSDDSDDNLMFEEVNENNIKMPTLRATNKHGKQLIQAVDGDNSCLSEGSLNCEMKTPDQGNNT